MPNRHIHIGAAMVVIVVLVLILALFKLDFTVSIIMGMLIGTLAPDIIEPATDYRHRHFFHSRKFLKYLFQGLLVSFVLALFISSLWWIFFFIVGYIIHLGLDSTTPMGLPHH